MEILKQLRLLLAITRTHGIVRRYFVVNGFDGALAMLGLNMGFFVSESVSVPTALSACLGTTLALGISGLSSGYVSESAERKKDLLELEQAMMIDLGESVYGVAARLVPFLVAAVNGLSPFLIGLLIILPLWLSHIGLPVPVGPIESAIAVAFVIIFLLGVQLAGISATSWWRSGMRTLLIALITSALIFLLSP